jgi:hypothetical protein
MNWGKFLSKENEKKPREKQGSTKSPNYIIHGKVFINSQAKYSHSGDLNDLKKNKILSSAIYEGNKLHYCFGIERDAYKREDAGTIINLLWDAEHVGDYKAAMTWAYIILCDVSIVNYKTSEVVATKRFRGPPPPQKSNIIHNISTGLSNLVYNPFTVIIPLTR